MAKFARGKYAYGFCDRTGFRYPLDDLVYEYANGVRTGLRVGRDMVDPDHPQNQTDELRTSEAVSLRDPRPDTTTDGLFGFNPIGNPAIFIPFNTGKLRVVIGDQS